MKRRDFLKLAAGVALAPIVGKVVAAGLIKPGQLNVAWDPVGGPDSTTIMYYRAVSIEYANGKSILAGDITAGQCVTVKYDGRCFMLQGV